MTWPIAIGVAVTVFAGYRALTASKRGGLVSHEMGARSGSPTLLLLHGSGAAGDDFVEIAEALIEEDGLRGVRIVALEAPYEYAGGLTWYRTDSEREACVEMLHRAVQAVEEDGVRREEVVVAGFSQGAEMAARLSAQHGPYGGAGLFSGRYDAAFRAGELTGLSPVFLAHGRQDAVLGFTSAAELAEDLEAAGITVQFEPFEGGHEIPDATRKTFVAWLTARLHR